MFWKILFRQMIQKRGMTLMLFLLISMLVMLFVYIKNTDGYVNRSMQLIMKNMGLNQLLVPVDTNPLNVYLCTGKQKCFPEADAAAMAQTTELLSKYYVAMLQKRMEIGGAEVILSGIRPMQRPDETMEKASMVKPVPKGKVRLGSIAAELLHRTVGESVEIGGTAYVIGQVLPEQGTVDDCRVYMRLDAAQQILSEAGNVHALLSFECLHVGGSLDYIHEYQREVLRENFPGYRQFNISSIAQGRFHGRRMTTNYLYYLGGIISLIAVLVIAICGFQDVAARRYETGVLISMGAGYGYISGLYLIKILIISLLASVVGYVVGVHLSVWLNTAFLVTNTQQVAIDWNPLSATVLASMGVALLGQLLPIIKLLSLDPHAILTEE